jgi:hypothetical protein
MTTCVSCPNGTVVRDSFTKCNRCQSGEFRNGTNCNTCGDGQYSLTPTQWLSLFGTTPPLNLQESCSVCQPGFVSRDVADPGDITKTIRTCEACSGRSIQPKAGQARCSSCESGRYANSDHTVCIPCTPGKFLDAALNLCVECSSGFYSATGQLDQCSPCQQGMYQPSEQIVRDSCVSCPAGQTKSSEGSGDCLRCPGGQVSNANRTQCIVCGDTSVFDCSSQTLVIPAQGAWFGGNIQDAFQLISGGGTAEAPLFKCQAPTACSNFYNETLGLNQTLCRTGHTGTLCAECISGYALDASTRLCTQCEIGTTALVKTAALAIGVIIGAVWFARRDQANAKRGQAVAILRIFLSYVQTLTLLGSFADQSSAVISEYLGSLDYATNPATKVFSPLQCYLGWRFHEEFFLMMSLPIIVVIFSYVSNFVMYVIRRSLPSKYAEYKSAGELWDEFNNKSIQSIAVLMLLVYLNVVSYIFKAFSFYASPINGKQYLQEDFRVTKDSEAYSTMSRVAVAAAVAYIGAWPVGLFVFLWRNQFKLGTSLLKERMKFLYDGTSYVGSPKWQERMMAYAVAHAEAGDLERSMDDSRAHRTRMNALSGSAAQDARTAQHRDRMLEGDAVLNADAEAEDESAEQVDSNATTEDEQTNAAVGDGDLPSNWRVQPNGEVVDGLGFVVPAAAVAAARMRNGQVGTNDEPKLKERART